MPPLAPGASVSQLVDDFIGRANHTCRLIDAQRVQLLLPALADSEVFASLVPLLPPTALPVLESTLSEAVAHLYRAAGLADDHTFHIGVVPGLVPAHGLTPHLLV